MGNAQTREFGVLNKSNMPEINVGLSRAGTRWHYYENQVKEGKVFYRRPGAVYFTVYAFVRSPDGRNDIADGITCANEIGSSIVGVVTAGITVATMGSMLTPAAMLFAPITTVGGTAGLMVEAAGAGGIAAFGAYASAQEATKAMGLAFQNSQLYCQMKGCYCGGDGSWLVVEGGPYQDSNGYFRAQDIIIHSNGRSRACV